MTSTHPAHYPERFSKVFDYIDDNLDSSLSVEQLAQVACFSKYHFHRLFSAITGLGVFQYVQLLRLKKAGYQLSFRHELKITDIALESGFENPESFSRSFKNVFGQTPSQFRQAPNWQHWQSTYEKIHQHKSDSMTDFDFADVKIADFPQTQVAAYEHQGSPMAVMNSVRTFIGWRKRNNLSPQTSQTYNIFYHDPASVEPQDYRMDICVTTDMLVPHNPEGIVNKSLEAGRCAVYRHIGSDSLLQHVIPWMYGPWLAQSDEQLRDFPLFIHRVNLFPDVSEHQMVSDIYLPLM